MMSDSQIHDALVQLCDDLSDRRIGRHNVMALAQAGYFLCDAALKHVLPAATDRQLRAMRNWFELHVGLAHDMPDLGVGASGRWLEKDLCYLATVAFNLTADVPGQDVGAARARLVQVAMAALAHATVHGALGEDPAEPPPTLPLPSWLPWAAGAAFLFGLATALEPR